MGNVVQGGVGQAPARQAAIKAGVPATVSAVTVNKVCGSGLKAVMLAAQSIRAGDAHLVLAGGQESMSNAPYYLYGARNGYKLGDQTLVDGVIRDGLWCPFCDVHMGGTPNTPRGRRTSRRSAQDTFALQSHRKAVAAMDAGKFAGEIVPVEVPGRKGPTVISADEGPRRDASLECLGKLKPAFPGDAPKDMKPGDLTVTAGNASSLNDGAAALVVASEAYARAQGLPILARITAYATGAVAPQDLFFAPVTAVRNLMRKEGRKIGDYDLIEANEAFASQALADGDRARMGLGSRQRARWRDRARPPHWREWCPRAHDTALRDARRGTPGRASPRCASAAVMPSPSVSSACPDQTPRLALARGPRRRLTITRSPDGRPYVSTRGVAAARSFEYGRSCGGSRRWPDGQRNRSHICPQWLSGDAHRCLH